MATQYFVALLTTLCLVRSALGVNCSPLSCASADANVCGGGSSAWHGTVEAIGECEVPSEEEGVTMTQQYIDLKIVEALYSDVAGVTASAGDVVRLDYGIKSVVDCDNPANAQNSRCQARCEDEQWDFRNTCCTFTEGTSYVIYADAIEDPAGATSKSICGQDSSLALSAESPCNRALAYSIEEPENGEIDLLKSACGTLRGVPISASQHAQVLFQGPVMLFTFLAAYFFTL